MPDRRFLLVVLALPLAVISETFAKDVPVGVARVDVTPGYPVRLHGFLSRKTESQGVRQQIWARAIAIGADADGPAVLITLDGLGIPDSLSETVARRLEKAGIQRERLALAATHTHSAPIIRDVAPNIAGEPFPPEHQAHIDQYTRELADKLEQVALVALSDRQPASLSYGIGTVRFAINRRTPGGPVDHDLPLLVVKSPEGKIRGLYVSYACHCVTLSDALISGDWAGYAVEHIERQHPGCVALVSVGCGADSNPSSGVTGGNVTACENQAVEIATEVDRLLAGPLTELPRVSHASWKRLDLPLAKLPTKEEWEARAGKPGAEGYYAKVQLEKLARGESLIDTIRYPVQTWQFGASLAMVFLPGEVVVDYSKRLKRELDGPRLWINAYANACPGYVPSERILQEGGYEGGFAMIYYDIPAPYAPGLEQKIVGEVGRQLDGRFIPRVDPSKTRGSLPLSPQQSVAALRTLPEFRVELVAAEPLVASPVAIEFGLKGELWVAEMYDYPAGVNGDYQPAGRIRRVIDSDGDGRFDRSNVFLAGIPFPTGVTLWRDGLLVCAAPDILFARDTNADGQADEVKTLYSGFGTDNYQARVNSLRYGLDGWVYGSCGLFGGEIKSFNGQSFPLGNRDFRIRPDTGEIEAVTGTTQQGRVRNDWGDWFGCNNGTLIQHYPVIDSYVRRNPLVAPPATVTFVHLGANPGKLFPISQSTLLPLSGPAGGVTAACGLEVYRDIRLGPEFRGDSFTCEPVNNLVHHLRLEPHGVTFAGQRAANEQDREFLASTDPWFRPVQTRTGPDGALWVVDMYRYVIEHPRWIPPQLVATLDVRAGHDMGRVYRVAPARADRGAEQPSDWSKLSTAELVVRLRSPNGWQRDLAQQMLAWNKNSAAIPLLKSLLTSDDPLARVHALCLLELQDGLDESSLAHGLEDSSPGVRRQALRIAERHFDQWPSLDKSLARSLESTDPHEQIQLAYSLGEWKSAQASLLLAGMLRRHGDNPDLRAAVLSSVNQGNLAGVLKHALAGEGLASQSGWAGPLLSLAASLGDSSTLAETLGLIVPAADQAVDAGTESMLAEVFESIERRQIDLHESLPAEIRARMGRVVAAARVTATGDRAESERLAAMRVLGRLPWERDKDLPALTGLLNPQASLAIQVAAVEILGRRRDEATQKQLLSDWVSHTPAIRRAVLEVLLSRRDGQTVLLDALEQGTVKATQIDATLRQRWMQTIPASLKSRAETLLAGPVDADRKKVIDAWQDVARLPGEGDRGKAVFKKACAACHQLDGVGHAVGQNIASLTNRTPQALLISLLDPSRQVDERYVAYTAATRDGRTVNGLLAEETSTSITLRAAEGKQETLLRSEVDELRSTGKSLMPEGLEKDLSKQEMADLFAYLALASPPRKEFPGNHPTVVGQTNEGSFSLPASVGEIFGNEIVFEVPFRNIGFWHGDQDRVVWNVEVVRPGRYDVWLDFACHADAAGNPFVLEAGQSVLRDKIPSTGTWDNYRQQQFGAISLEKGPQRVTLRPDGPLRAALVDLRGMLLVPHGAKVRFPWIVAQAEPAAEFTVDPRKSTPAEYASRILDGSVPEAERAAIVQSQPHICAELIREMASGLTFGTAEASKEEYRRIPWIWNVAIAAGKRNNADQFRRILDVSLPRDDEPLRDWQAVVVGGGLINGVSQSGEWPRERIAGFLRGNTSLESRWTRLLEQAAVMADDESVAAGTRYDALRILGVDTWDHRGKELVKYLAKGVNDELQMGAISGLSDVQSPEVTPALLSGMRHYSAHNRNLALDALLRNPHRAQALLNAVSGGNLTGEDLGPTRMQQLREHADDSVREAARKILGN